MKRIEKFEKLKIEEFEKLETAERDLFNAYCESKDSKLAVINFRDFLWGNTKKVAHELTELGIHDITVSCQSTSLMTMLDDFASSGFEACGMCHITINGDQEPAVCLYHK